jgi:hypothetical protein
MKLQIYTKHEWKTPMYLGFFGFLICLFGFIYNLFTKGGLANIIGFLIFAIFFGCLGYFAGYKKRKADLDETIIDVEKFSILEEKKSEEINEVKENVGNIA